VPRDRGLDRGAVDRSAAAPYRPPPAHPRRPGCPVMPSASPSAGSNLPGHRYVDTGTAGRFACRVLAWTICMAAILGGGTTAFRLVEWHARGEFRARFGRPGVPVVDVRDVVGVVRLADGAEVEQPFRTDRDGLDGLQVRTVNWKAVPAAAECRWRLELEPTGGGPRRVVRSGRIDPRQAGDWSFLEIPFAPLPDSSRAALVLVVTGPSDDPGAAMGLPLFSPVVPHPLAVVRPSAGAAGCLHLMLLHPEAAP